LSRPSVQGPSSLIEGSKKRGKRGKRDSKSSGEERLFVYNLSGGEEKDTQDNGEPPLKKERGKIQNRRKNEEKKGPDRKLSCGREGRSLPGGGTRTVENRSWRILIPAAV